MNPPEERAMPRSEMHTEPGVGDLIAEPRVEDLLEPTYFFHIVRLLDDQISEDTATSWSTYQMMGIMIHE